MNNDYRANPSDIAPLTGGANATGKVDRPAKEALTLSALQSSVLMSKNVSTNVSARELLVVSSGAAQAANMGEYENIDPSFIKVSADVDYLPKSASSSNANSINQSITQTSNMNLANYSVRVGDFRQQAAVQAYIA